MKLGGGTSAGDQAGAGEGVPKASGERGGEDGEQEDVAKLLGVGGNGPTEAGDEEEDAGEQEDVQFEEDGEWLALRKAGQEECAVRAR